VGGGREAFEPQGPDGDADQAQGGQAGGGGHAADLAVAAFDEGEFEPGGGNGGAEADGRGAGGQVRLEVELADLSGAGEVVLNADAAAEEFEGFGGWAAFDLGPVGAGVGEAGIGEAVLEGAIGGEQEEAFGVAVEAAGGVDVGDLEVVREGGVGSTGLRGELGEDAVGFVEEEGAGHQRMRAESEVIILSNLTRCSGVRTRTMRALPSVRKSSIWP